MIATQVDTSPNCRHFVSYQRDAPAQESEPLPVTLVRPAEAYIESIWIPLTAFTVAPPDSSDCSPAWFALMVCAELLLKSVDLHQGSVRRTHDGKSELIKSLLRSFAADFLYSVNLSRPVPNSP